MRSARRLALLLAAALAASSCSEEPLVQVKTALGDDKGLNYFSSPWPDDRRLRDDGTINTRRFPNPGKGSYVANMLATADHVLAGWGSSSPIYVPFSGPLDTSTLPKTPQDSVADGASIFLVAIDPASKAYGQRVPLEWHYYAETTMFLPGNVLAVRPVVGLPLLPRTRYALIITYRLKDALHRCVVPDAEFATSREGLTTDAKTAGHYVPLWTYVDAAGIDRAQVAGAVVFTTGVVLDELRRLYDFLKVQDPPPFTLEGVKVTTTHVLYVGTYPAPNFMHGAPPYFLEGGEFRYGADGTPIPYVTEPMRVGFSVPRGPPPAAGFPLVLYAHGTGGNYLHFEKDIAGELAKVDVASAGIDQVLTGPRAPAGSGCFGQAVEACFFNPINAVAGRNLIRQAALDNVMLRKMLGNVVIPASVAYDGYEVRFDVTRLGFFGHSQGALTGSLYVALESDVRAAVLSGGGGHLTTTVLERKDPFDVKVMSESPLFFNIEGKESLDQFHPALALVQTAADVADPLSYARYWVREPLGAPKNVYMTSGLEDPYTTPDTAEALAAAAGLPQMAPVGRPAHVFSVVGLAPVLPPVSNNLTGPLKSVASGLFRQFPGAGHFPAFDDPTARSQWRELFATALWSSRAEIPAP